MASAISPDLMRSGLFVELGAGTGPVTEALLRRKIPPERMVVIEKSPALAECLSLRFPEVKIICCGAEEMRDRLGTDLPVRAIVSSLPFRSLPSSVSCSIMKEIETVLAPGGLYIQFTYALIGEIPYIPAAFHKIRSNLVLCNLTPAKVEVFRKPKVREEVSDCEEG
jgi:phosphatidylethanolamine/phosphatidyl-N-methylethanolamine N-methyltransferase